MFPQALVDFFAANQEVLWLTTLMLDLGGTVVLYRLFGKAGLQVAIATAIILANLQGPKLTIIFGLETSLGVIFYSSIFFATDVLSENYGKHEAARAVWMGFTVSVIVLVMMSLGLMYLPSTNPKTAAFSQDIQDSFSTILNFSPRFVFGSQQWLDDGFPGPRHDDLLARCLVGHRRSSYGNRARCRQVYLQAGNRGHRHHIHLLGTQQFPETSPGKTADRLIRFEPCSLPA
jgi:hypothetical protein